MAAALNAGGDALYGRYWGATEYVPGLHFETCYMQAIAYCIAHGFARFEGGAQGTRWRAACCPPHWSAHWVADPRFADAIQRFLDEETTAVEGYWTNWKRTHRSSRTRPIVLVKSPPSNYPTKPTLAA